MARLSEIFLERCSEHAFLNRLLVTKPFCEPVAPPLRLAIACVASVQARHGAAEARDLFLASRALMGFSMEVDNREARSLDLLMTVCTLRLGDEATLSLRTFSLSRPCSRVCTER